MKHKYCGVNCSRCGRWVGKDGFMDAYCDEYNGSALEVGYPLCKSCLDGNMKYREYRFTSNAHLIDIVEIWKLPKNARKMHGVWIATHKDGGYSKICRIDSNITFGTGLVSMRGE